MAFVLWMYLFSASSVDPAPPRYPTAAAAKPAAVDAGGRYRWPGTHIEVHQIDSQRVDVERRWLSMRESVVVVEQTPAGWEVGVAGAGPAHALQVFLACIIPGVLIGFVVVAALRRRPTASVRARSASGDARGNR